MEGPILGFEPEAHQTQK
ncbi:uncharacterized protein G2W53_010837 [Senna tora]|uniref:Uncharacterized protein n=1 Tax=Senna tora TaxID=362788 RepID=A0A834X1S6_9FABA|nr:uncharacterized protein G2W53_010837 [Senna tora]